MKRKIVVLVVLVLVAAGAFWAFKLRKPDDRLVLSGSIEARDVQVGSLVGGHVAGLMVAHDRAVTILPERDALRSQYAMLALMVVYTVGGMWLLSRN